MKPVVDGDCEGEVVLVDQYMSFLGEVDPVRGIVKTEKEEISVEEKILVFKGSRGSTVGSYVIYAMKQYGRSPLCMLVKEVEPILIAGCVIAEIPLLVVEEYDDFAGTIKNKNHRYVRYTRGSGILYAW
ncbi:aconitase X swivel domain-containing protein [Desulfurococcus amylolyticus]|uniref:Putative aconitase subunit 2 n=1 Tax=Desulfurococcus amylolyticus DSM 16532 TaxID=768672 RepID=I3XQA4_DESAM|nr:DUF126 domain-containing protein [Desulfurococcus amylolyticus]AFL66128.1 putative aconitase subunit 2 [Desulfurococcus amylolyticus DSM 16532]